MPERDEMTTSAAATAETPWGVVIGGPAAGCSTTPPSTPNVSTRPRWRQPHLPDLSTVSGTQLHAHIVELLGADAHAFDIAAIAARTYRWTGDAFTLSVTSDEFWDVVRDCEVPGAAAVTRLRAAVTEVEGARTRYDDAPTERDAAIVAARAAGVSVSAICVATGLSKPGVYKILRSE